MKHTSRRLTAAAITLSLIAASCGSDDDSSATTAAPGTTGATGTTTPGTAGSTTPTTQAFDPAGVLRIATPQFANIDMVLDQGNGPYASVQHFMMQLYTLGSLFTIDKDGNAVPYLAASATNVDDTTVTVKLRPNLKFQDGTAYDAPTLANIIMTKYKPLAGGVIFNASILRNITAVEAPDATTMTFRLDRPIAGLLPITLATGLVGVFASPASTDPSRLIGAGPYRIREYVKDNRVVAEKWDGFVDAAKYKLGGIQWLNIPTIEAAQNALQGGQVDLIATNPRDADAVASQGAFKTVVTNNQGAYNFLFCGSAPPWDNPKFREAIDLALNREQLNQVALGGKAEPSSSLWPKDSKYAVANAIDTNGDQARARQLLTEVGWDGNKVIPLGVFPGFQTHQLIMEVVSAQLAAVGVKTQIATVEGGDFARFTNATTGAMHMVGNTNVGLAAINVPSVGAPSVFNPCGVAVPEIQALVTNMSRGSVTEAQLTADWKKASEIVAKQRPWFQVMTQPAVYVHHTRVQGIGPGTIGTAGTTVPQPYLEEVSIRRG